MEKIHTGDTFFDQANEGRTSRPDLIFFKNCQVTLEIQITPEVDSQFFRGFISNDHTPFLFKCKKILNQTVRPF
jgi:hypothetical protein